MRALYLCDIAESPARDGTFTATLRDYDINTTGRDPEHDICRALIEAGLPDAPIQFYRGSVRTLRFKSSHATGRRRSELGKSFPYACRARREGPIENLEKSHGGVRQDGQTDDEGYSGITADDSQPVEAVQ